MLRLSKRYSYLFSIVKSYIKNDSRRQLSQNILWKPFTTWKVSVFEVILVRIFPHSDWVRPDSIQMQENTDQNYSKNRHIYAVFDLWIATELEILKSFLYFSWWISLLYGFKVLQCFKKTLSHRTAKFHEYSRRLNI